MGDLVLVMGVSDCGIPPELGRFRLGSAEEEARYSADSNALFVPKLHLQPGVIRGVVQGGTIYRAMCGVQLLMTRYHRFDNSLWSYCWGDLAVFENGEPDLVGSILLRGRVEMPDLHVVSRYVKEMLKPE